MKVTGGAKGRYDTSLEEIGSMESARDEGTDDMGDEGEEREYCGGNFKGVVQEESNSEDGRTRATTRTRLGIFETWSLELME